MKRIVIIGAGPTGLSAGFRLKELGYDNFIIYEKNSYVGGLCASFKDNMNFIWDLGGHVIFSNHEYFHKLLEKLIGRDFLSHKRQSWIRTDGRWIPYPFQNNIRHLPSDMFLECLKGIMEAEAGGNKANNFREWVLMNLGEGIAKHFMFPYNQKVWAYPLHLLSSEWINERVSKINLKDFLVNLITEKDNTAWGNNAVFKYPLYGGTGQIFQKMAFFLLQNIMLNTEIVKIEPGTKKVYLSNEKVDCYDILLNTSPLNAFVEKVADCKEDVREASSALKHNSVFIVGLGINKPCPSSKCWMYFPDDNGPFFRVTYLSNYSPNNVPDSGRYYSLLCESSYSEYKQEDKSEIIEKTIRGLINSGLLTESDRGSIVSKFLFDIEYAYPIPTLQRNDALQLIQTYLEKLNIYSRGRFGGWKYEIANTDHSVMQGKEIIDKLFKKGRENVWSL